MLSAALLGPANTIFLSLLLSECLPAFSLCKHCISYDSQMTFIVMHFRDDSNILKTINGAVKGTGSLLDVKE